MRIVVRITLALLCFFLFAFPVFAEEGREDVWWVCPSAEAAMFKTSGLSSGGAVAIAYGSGASLGLKAAYFLGDKNEADVLELSFLLRIYFFGGEATSGPFIQVSGGPAIFVGQDEDVSLKSEWGTISAGLAFGWRISLGDAFFVEPYIRGGYPFLVGGGLSAGIHF